MSDGFSEPVGELAEVHKTEFEGDFLDRAGRVFELLASVSPPPPFPILVRCFTEKLPPEAIELTCADSGGCGDSGTVPRHFEGREIQIAATFFDS